ncbi:MAG: hypothetical protein L0Y56_18775, partial [Nitrospira sp.]|nr:hypothetical protein [Nitrospira sp.]
MADMINLVIGSRLEASIKPMGEESAPAFPITVSGKSYLDIIEGNIFNVKMRGQKQGVTSVPQAEVIQTPPPDLRVILIGTVVGEEGNSYAIIENQVTREQSLYRLGESIDNQAKILKIGRIEVVLLVGDTQRSLRLYLDEEESGVGMAGMNTQEAGIVKVTPNQWVLDRQEITVALDNLPQL